jgi:hypothetical protein
MFGNFFKATTNQEKNKFKLSLTEFIKKHYPWEITDKQLEMIDFSRQEGTIFILGEREIGKTDLCCIMSTAYDILCDPVNTTRLFITAEEERGKMLVSSVRNLLMAEELELSSHAANSIQTAAAPNHRKERTLMSLTRFSSSLKGNHPNKIILDDLCVLKDRWSPTERERTRAFFGEYNALTLNILVLANLIHPNDLYSDLRKRLDVKKMEIAYGEIPEIEKPLELLQEKFDEWTLETQYFLKFPEMAKLPFTDSQVVDDATIRWHNSKIFIDPSFEGTDFTSLAIIKLVGDKIYIKGWNFVLPWYECIDQILQEYKKHNCTRCVFEENTIGKEPMYVLEDRAKKLDIEIFLDSYRSTLNKHRKIMALLSKYPAKNLILSNQSNEAFINEFFLYEYGVHTDSNDVVASGALYNGWITVEQGKEEKGLG